MAIRGLFFNSVDGDRVYNAEDWDELFSRLRSEGVILDDTEEMEVTPISPEAMQVRVGTGAAFIDGKHALNADPENLNISNNNSGSTRIDRVVARVNYGSRSVEFGVLQGTPGSGAPGLTRDSSNYEISLARVTVNDGAVQISPGDIADERLDEAVCGISRVQEHIHHTSDVTSGTFGVNRGGTGRSSLTSGTFLRGAGTGAVDMRTASQVLADIAAAPVNHNHGAGDINSGTFPVARGGTGRASLTSGNFFRGAGTNAVTERTPAQVLSDIGAAPSHSHPYAPSSHPGGSDHVVASASLSSPSTLPYSWPVGLSVERAASASGWPASGTLFVMSTGGTASAQVIQVLFTTGSIYFRGKAAGDSWQPWRQVEANVF